VKERQGTLIMKNKLMILAAIFAVATVAVVHARRGRAPIINQVTVNPLDGYAGQIGDEESAPEPIIQNMESGSLLDDPLK
jgi:hypothetical protein